MFHRPNHRPEMFLTEYLTDRQPLNPYQWIDQAPLLEAWLAAKMIEAVPQSAPSEELTSPAENMLERKVARIAGAVQTLQDYWVPAKVRAARSSMVSIRILLDIGCSDFEASTIIYSETPDMHNTSERAAEVKRLTEH